MITLWQRIKDAVFILIVGQLPVERRLLRKEAELQSLISMVVDEVEKLNTAQARHLEAVRRREKKEQEDAVKAHLTTQEEGVEPIRPTKRATKAELRQRAREMEEKGELTSVRTG